ncbi:hypothetical protein HHI36_022858 [Cryptolaemus montrouzieri]|uniref:Uncharacterized protein n=1 Tax=Cryptolaemus montrouzieri TaxID=559131 RepID=A0ABD2PF33_9CUCU
MLQEAGYKGYGSVSRRLMNLRSEEDQKKEERLGFLRDKSTTAVQERKSLMEVKQVSVRENFFSLMNPDFTICNTWYNLPQDDSIYGDRLKNNNNVVNLFFGVWIVFVNRRIVTARTAFIKYKTLLCDKI